MYAVAAVHRRRPVELRQLPSAPVAQEEVRFSPTEPSPSQGDRVKPSPSSLQFSPTSAGNFIALGGVIAAPLLVLHALFARRTQDRHILARTAGLVVFVSVLGGGTRVGYGALLVCWAAVAVGFNVGSTVTLSLMSKMLPPAWNGRSSLAVQYAINLGWVAGAVWGGSGIALGMRTTSRSSLALLASQRP